MCMDSIAHPRKDPFLDNVHNIAGWHNTTISMTPLALMYTQEKKPHAYEIS